MFMVTMMVVVTAIISIFQVYKSLICSQAGEPLNELFRKRREDEGGREEKRKGKQRDRDTPRVLR